MRRFFTADLARLDFYAHWQTLPPYYSAIDPFDYCDRLGILKLLIEAVNVNGAFGADNELNPLWGYVFQLAWQWRSGRLQFADTPPSSIDPRSLWSAANYSFSVIPLIAAIKLGVVKPVTIRAPHSVSVFDYPGGDSSGYAISPTYGRAIAAWSDFFTQALQLPAGADLEPLRFTFWHAHIQSLRAVLPSIRQYGGLTASATEVQFALGWMRMPWFFAPAAWRTDLEFMLQQGFGILPERVLTVDDVPGRIPDMSPLVNHNIVNLIALARQRPLAFAIRVYLWRRAMRSALIRADVFTYLDALLNPKQRNRRLRLRLIKQIATLRPAD
ncbi:MAG: hypothetical protein J0M07_19260 [Anaerolineae bacterium]|nr:hypothetical protein [Anaerolineae bacterium]